MILCINLTTFRLIFQCCKSTPDQYSTLKMNPRFILNPDQYLHWIYFPLLFWFSTIYRTGISEIFRNKPCQQIVKFWLCMLCLLTISSAWGFDDQHLRGGWLFQESYCIIIIAHWLLKNCICKNLTCIHLRVRVTLASRLCPVAYSTGPTHYNQLGISL